MTPGERDILARAFVGVGSNLGDRGANLDQALAELAAAGVRVISRSSVYRTAPVGVPDQPEFLNQVVEVETALPPDDLLALLHRAEAGMERREEDRAGPRPIDLDLLLYGDLVRPGPGLILPHPRMHLRRFVLVPLCEIAPDLRHPVLGSTMRDLLAALDPSGQRVEKVRPGRRPRGKDGVDPPGGLG